MTRYSIPATGGNPSSSGQGTTPGSFANAARVGTAWTFSSPDAPGMPPASERTAWDFMPLDWTRRADGSWSAPDGFQPVTQLEFARLGIVTPEMRRVAE
ncbi:MAG TPA: thiamine biosynthesis protein ThiC, partial [Myxococcota bacterium]|nr:thiamine biosynthesis protein ThiC [Myxococcota bacterium]